MLIAFMVSNPGRANRNHVLMQVRSGRRKDGDAAADSGRHRLRVPPAAASEDAVGCHHSWRTHQPVRRIDCWGWHAQCTPRHLVKPDVLFFMADVNCPSIWTAVSGLLPLCSLSGPSPIVSAEHKKLISLTSQPQYSLSFGLIAPYPNVDLRCLD
jgi:hypothetical protein